MATRTRKTTAKQTTTAAAKKTTSPARKPTAKKTPPAKPDTDRATVVDTRPELPVRRRVFVGPMGAHEQAAIRAALAAAAIALPVPVRAWNGSQAHLADGVLLIHNAGTDRIFTANIACQHGAIHGYPITTAQDLREARALTHACERRHADPSIHDGTEYDWDKAIHPRPRPQAVFPVPVPLPGEPTTGTTVLAIPATRRVLADQLTHKPRTTAAATQPIPQEDIAAVLAGRATDNETAKEHPQP